LLGDECDGFQYGLNSQAVEFDGVHGYLRITDIDNESSQFLNSGLTSPASFDEKHLVLEGDILFARTGASVGKSYLYSKQDGKLYFAGFLIRAHINKGTNSFFVYYQTKTKRFKEWVKQMSARSGQPGINSKEFASFSFFKPKREEQEKIASLLYAIDHRTLVQRKIIEDLELLSKAITDSVFSESICSTDLGKYIVQRTERAGEKRFPVFSISNEIGFLPQKTQFSGRELASENVSRYKVVQKGDFAFNPARINVGSISQYMGVAPVIISPMYIVFVPKKQGYSDLLNSYFKSSFFSNSMKRKLEGSVRKCLSLKSLCSLGIPDDNEQKRSALLAIDNLIRKQLSFEETIFQKEILLKGYFLNSLFI